VSSAAASRGSLARARHAVRSRFDVEFLHSRSGTWYLVLGTWYLEVGYVPTLLPVHGSDIQSSIDLLNLV